MAEHRLAGEAFAGPVTAAEPDRLDSSGKRRKLRPLITVITEDPVRIDAGATLVSPSRPSQQATSGIAGAPAPPGPAVPAGLVAAAARRRAEVVLELSGGMGHALTAEPGSVPEPGERVCYTMLTDSYQPVSSFPDREHTPWTHGGPPPEYVPADEDATEAWS